MKETTLKAGIVGSGFSARFHYESLMRVHGVNVEVGGVYSPTPEKRAAYAAERGIPERSSLEELVEAADVIHVCSPPKTHEDVAVAALTAGRSVIIEKPFTGYFGDGSDGFDGRRFSREEGLARAMDSVRRIRQAERESSGTVLYAENWIYSPVVQKEREIIEKTEAQILWMHGEEAHSGSHSTYYGVWSHSGGGSVMGKGVHPLATTLYFKRVEGRRRLARPIRPAAVSCRVHRVTGMPGYVDKGFLRTDYSDVEDFGHVHVVFEDGTFADVFASELVLGGVHNWMEVVANNHRGICNINPNTSVQTFNPYGPQFDDVYVVEKIGTKEGWASTSADEDWFNGYQHEMEAFYRNVAEGSRPEADSQLAADTIAVVYAGYLSAERGGAEVEVPRG